MHVEDLANGILFLLGLDSPPDWVNLGTGVDHSILSIAELVKEAVGFQGEITKDESKPDGMPLKRLDVSLARTLGWSASISLEEGIHSAYNDFLESLRSKTARL